MDRVEELERIPQGQYVFSPIQKVSFGPGSVSVLPDEIGRLGATRPFLVTTKSVAASPLLGTVERILGSGLTGTFAGVQQHTPSGNVVELASRLRDAGADIVVSLGGGSVIDCTKAAVLALARDTGRFLPHVSLPTTLSAAEFSPRFGVTDEETRVKVGSSNPFVQPQFVILDVNLTVHTPDWLWYATGVRALDHAVETVYAPDRQPATDAAALHAIRLLFQHLPDSAGSEAINARQQLQIAAWLSFFGVENITLGLSHTLGREIGPRYNVPHGYTSAVLLPKVMAFLEPETQPAQAAIAEAAGVERRGRALPEMAMEAAPAVFGLIGRLGLPQRLRDLNVPGEDLPDLAGGRPDVLHVLQEAW